MADEWGNALEEPVIVEVAETGAVTGGWGGVTLYAPKGAKVVARAKFLLFTFASEAFIEGPTELVIVLPVQTARVAALGAAACAAAVFVAARRKRLKAGGKAAAQPAN